MKIATSIKLDKDIKTKASKIASDLGLNLSSVINSKLKQFILERRLVISVPADLSADEKKDLKLSLKELKQKNNLVGPFESIKDLKRSLLS